MLYTPHRAPRAFISLIGLLLGLPSIDSNYSYQCEVWHTRNVYVCAVQSEDWKED